MHLGVEGRRGGRVLGLALLGALMLGGCRHVQPVAADADEFIEAEGTVVQLLLEPSPRGPAMRGFVLQAVASEAALADGRAAGIFVGTSTNRGLRSAQGEFVPAVGDVLHVRGRRKSLSGRPSIVEAELVNVSARGVDLAQALPPFDVNPPADAIQAEAYWAAREGMRGRVPAGARVQGAHYGGGENQDETLTVIREDLPWLEGRAPYAQRVFRDAHPLDDDPSVLADNGNGFRITLAAGGIKHDRDDATATLPLLNVFDRIGTPLDGVVLRTQGRYALHVEPFAAFEPGPDPARNLPPTGPVPAATLRVATFNIENLYDHRDDPFDPNDDVDRGARGDAPRNRKLHDYVSPSAEAYALRLRGLAGQIVVDLQSPDALLLQEVEDQDIGVMAGGKLLVSAVNNRDGALDVLQELAVEIISQGGPRYVTAADRAGADERGIICAFMVREDRLRLSTVDVSHPVMGGVPKLPGGIQAVAYGFGAANPRAINAHVPVTGLIAPRAPMVLCVESAPGAETSLRRGQRLYLINNHFKSRPQQYVDERIAQARLTAAMATALMSHDPGAGVIVGGDLNTFPRPDEPVPEKPADQLGALYEAGLYNVHDWQLAHHPAGAYTYVFEGQAQTLDHLFVSASLKAALHSAAALHINADHAPNPRDVSRHCSDHDPVLAVFGPLP